MSTPQPPQPHPRVGRRGLPSLARLPRPSTLGHRGKLRAWQAEALEAYRARRRGTSSRSRPRAPARRRSRSGSRPSCSSAGTVRRVTVVAPTEHLKPQWADAAARVGIRIDPAFTQRPGPARRRTTTASRSPTRRSPRSRRCTAPGPRPRRTLVDPRRGPPRRRRPVAGATRCARRSSRPTRRLALTGTPFRSDTAAIPFVRYERGPRRHPPRRGADHSYGYGDALRDDVVRPVLFLSYSGQMRWRTKAGDEVSARLGEPLTKDMTAQAWRTALDPNGEWIPSVLRRGGPPAHRGAPHRARTPAALVIATDQTDARAYAGHLRGSPASPPTVVLSDDDGASERIDGVLRRHRPLDGRRADGLRGRRRAAARGRRLRDLDLDAAVLRPGRRPVRAGPTARRDGVDLPAERPAAARRSPARWRPSATTPWTGR